MAREFCGGEVHEYADVVSLNSLPQQSVLHLLKVVALHATNIFRSVNTPAPQAAFLPHGYPESVSDDYLTYQIWDTAQAFCSSITNILSSHALLRGYGVGNAEASAAAALYAIKQNCTCTSLCRKQLGKFG